MHLPSNIHPIHAEHGEIRHNKFDFASVYKILEDELRKLASRAFEEPISIFSERSRSLRNPCAFPKNEYCLEHSVGSDSPPASCCYVAPLTRDRPRLVLA